jgi:hypothetical protein
MNHKKDRLRSVALKAAAAVLLTSGLFCATSVAWAGGGPGDIFTGLVEFLLCAGIVLGIACGSLVRRPSARRWLYAVPLVVALLLVLGSQWVLIWSSILLPGAVAFLGLFAAAGLLARQSNAPTDGPHPVADQKTIGRRLFGLVKSKRTGKLLVWLCSTYVFWSAFALFNVSILGVLAVPLLWPRVAEGYGKFMPFVAPPLACALAIAVIVAAVSRYLLRSLDKRLTPFIFNFALLIAFLTAGELYKDHLIDKALADRHPRCAASKPFLESLQSAAKIYRPSHGWYEEGGARYIWSYSERKFVLWADIPVNQQCRASL